MEEKKEVKTFIINYKCDKCATGNLKSTGVALMCNPPKYYHYCNLCHNKKTLKNKYPIITHEET